MTGVFGIEAGYHALMACDTLLLLGCDFAWRQFYPEQGHASFRSISSLLTSAAAIRSTRRRRRRQSYTFLPDATPNRRADRAFLDDSLAATYEGRRDSWQARGVNHGGKIHPQYLDQSDRPSRRCGRDLHRRWRLAHGLAAASHTANGKRRTLTSLTHGTMANAMPQALAPRRPFPTAK